jgi:hypothetical protein
MLAVEVNMRAETRSRPPYSVVVVLAMAAVAAVGLGVPWRTVVLVAVVVACPLMMLLMGRGGREDPGTSGDAPYPPAGSREWDR